MNSSGEGPQYIGPDPCAMQHKSLKGVWWVLEVLPKSTWWPRWPRWSLLGWYVPWAEPRLIPKGAVIDSSVADRQDCPKLNYAPKNLKPRDPLPKEGSLAPVLRRLSGAAVLAGIAIVTFGAIGAIAAFCSLCNCGRAGGR